MSSAERDQTGRAERPRSFTRFIRRASKAMRPKERSSLAESPAPSSSNAPAAAGTAAAGSSAAAAPAAVAGTSKPADHTTGSYLPRTVAPKFVRPPTPKTEVIRSTPTNAAAHFRLQEERARALFAKYNMQLEAGEWSRVRSPSAMPQEWVEKKVRVRVHRQCHRCRTHFGGDKTCGQCGHARCKKCPRSPDKSLRDPAKKAAATVAIDPDPSFRHDASDKRADRPRLTMEGKHGTELVRRVPQHRVRRTCHKCDTLFVGRATTCENCKHLRCAQCPREPPKEKKWPDGYPGDEEEKFPLAERTFRKTRQRVRWTCHECHSVFKQSEQECRGCKHGRCDECTREPPKKVRKEPEPDILRSLEQRLGGMAITAPAVAAA